MNWNRLIFSSLLAAVAGQTLPQDVELLNAGPGVQGTTGFGPQGGSQVSQNGNIPGPSVVGINGYNNNNNINSGFAGQPGFNPFVPFNGFPPNALGPNAIGNGYGPGVNGYGIRNSAYRQFDILPHPEAGWRVTATMTGSNPDAPVSGTLTFKQWDPQHVLVTVNMTGLPPGRHAVHVHSFGDLTQGCSSTGPHFRSNLIGNIEAKQDGMVFLQFYSPYVRLFSLTGIVGRSIVIHEKESNYDKYPSVYSPPTISGFDDPASYQRDEDAVGPILSCGIVTITNNVE